jgi:hypothetical protein
MPSATSCTNLIATIGIDIGIIPHTRLRRDSIAPESALTAYDAK